MPDSNRNLPTLPPDLQQRLDALDPDDSWGCGGYICCHHLHLLHVLEPLAEVLDPQTFSRVVRVLLDEYE